MTRGLRELQPAELTLELENVAVPLLVEQLRSRAAGHCMRVADLDTELMVRLCARLRAELPKTTVVVLTDGRVPVPPELSVTSTKLVEMRNPLPDGTLRPPLLVFVPNDVRASAEDSFGVATFENVAVDGLYVQLRQRLLSELPSSLRGAVQESLRRLQESERPWPFADALSTSRFLLTGKVNGNDPEALGASLYELGLVPDFEWLAQPEKAPPRLVRNKECVERLTWSGRSERGRVREIWAREARVPEPTRGLPRRDGNGRPTELEPAHRSGPRPLAPRVQQVGVRGRRRGAGVDLHRGRPNRPSHGR